MSEGVLFRERRFCVLDGPMERTCWETTEGRPLTDDELERITRRYPG